MNTLYFIKGDSRANWAAMKIIIVAKGASLFAVISSMETRGWQCVTLKAFNAWRKKNMVTNKESAHDN